MGLTKPRASQIFDIDYKQATRVITVSNVTLTGGAPSVVDGVSLTAGDRVLVTGQSTGSENGLYAVSSVGIGSDGTWVRTNDGNEDGEIQAGMIVMVTEGATYADTQWKLTTDGTIDIGTTALTFVRNGAAAYGVIAVAGQSSIAANSVGDTLTVATGNNIVVTTNAGTETLTIAVSDTITATGNITGGNITTAGIGTFGTMTDGTVSFTSGNISGVDELRIDQSGAGLRMTNVGAFDNDGSDNFRIFSTNDLKIAANGENGTAITIDATNQDVTIANDLRVDTGNITAGNVIATIVGDVTGDVTGNITGSAATATSATTAGTVTTAAQPNITSVGTLSSVTVTGNVSAGNVDGTRANFTNLVGTLETATQTNITSVGTLGSLSVTGNVSAGNVDGTTGAFTTLNATGNITGGNLITAGSITLNQLSLNSDLTTVSPLQLTAGSLQDGVGALRIDAVEPDIYLNDTNSSGHSTVTFATGNVPAAAIGKDNNEDFYITVNTGSGWLDTTFIADHLTGNISLGHNLAVTGNITGGNLITAGDVEIQARSELKLFDSDSSHYVAIVPPATVSANVTFVLPGDAGTSDYVLSTNGAGTLSWIEQSGGGGSGASSFPNSTVTPLPSSEGNFDLSYNYAQTTQETPFESGGTDAFGVSLGEVYSMMDPAGDIPAPTDLGILA